jgi:hypothetical protein
LERFRGTALVRLGRPLVRPAFDLASGPLSNRA